jgi:hypothetical protein
MIGMTPIEQWTHSSDAWHFAWISILPAGWICIIGFFSSRISGWARLARRFRATQAFCGNARARAGAAEKLETALKI